MPVDSFYCPLQPGLFHALRTKIEIGISTLMKRHERGAECQIHHRRRKERPQKTVPKRFGILKGGQQAVLHHANDAIGIDLHHKGDGDTDCAPYQHAKVEIVRESPAFSLYAQSKYLAAARKQPKL